MMLLLAGFEAEHFKDGLAASEAVADRPADHYSLIFLDQNMARGPEEAGARTLPLALAPALLLCACVWFARGPG